MKYAKDNEQRLLNLIGLYGGDATLKAVANAIATPSRADVVIRATHTSIYAPDGHEYRISNEEVRKRCIAFLRETATDEQLEAIIGYTGLADFLERFYKNLVREEDERV